MKIILRQTKDCGFEKKRVSGHLKMKNIEQAEKMTEKGES